VARQAAGDQDFSSWEGLSGSTVGPPAVALDASSRATVFSVGPTGLSVLEQDATGSSQPFDVWRDLGM
jgi:hypothetical protein